MLVFVVICRLFLVVCILILLCVVVNYLLFLGSWNFSLGRNSKLLNTRGVNTFCFLCHFLVIVLASRAMSIQLCNDLVHSFNKHDVVLYSLPYVISVLYHFCFILPIWFVPKNANNTMQSMQRGGFALD